jgi:hypothetical protein
VRPTGIRARPGCRSTGDPRRAGSPGNFSAEASGSRGRRSGPVTGGKYLELLKEALPKLTRVAILLDPTFPGLADA